MNSYELALPPSERRKLIRRLESVFGFDHATTGPLHGVDAHFDFVPPPSIEVARVRRPIRTGLSFEGDAPSRRL